MYTSSNLPVSVNERADILDILRGFALAGICVANYPTFSLYGSQPEEVRAAMPTAAIDQLLIYFHITFIEGKFYTLFSLLFGIGFSIIYMRNKQKGSRGLKIFYRRLLILMFIGFAHILLLWMGDILLLYALLGMLLPLFRRVGNRQLLVIWMILILSPLFFDALKVVSDNQWNLSNPLRAIAIELTDKQGMTMENFSYSGLLKYNQSGFFWRYQGFLDSNRIPKVLGMFLLGLYAGRKLIFKNLEAYRPLLKSVQRWGFGIGLPASMYVWLKWDHQGLPEAIGLLNTLFYALSVVPLSLAYTTTLCLWYLTPKGKANLQWLAAPGRMALTNYLMQSVIAIGIFYGIGLGLGASTGLAYVFMIALSVYAFQVWFSFQWLKHFRYGPMEWVWRCLTYGKLLSIRKEKIQLEVKPEAG